MARGRPGTQGTKRLSKVWIQPKGGTLSGGGDPDRSSLTAKSISESRAVGVHEPVAETKTRTQKEKSDFAAKESLYQGFVQDFLDLGFSQEAAESGAKNLYLADSLITGSQNREETGTKQTKAAQLQPQESAAARRFKTAAIRGRKERKGKQRIKVLT